MNEANYLDQSGDMMYPTPKHQGMLMEADIAEIKGDRSSSPTTVLEFEDESKQVDAMIPLFVVALDPGEPNPDEVLNFKSDPTRAHVADASCVYNSHLFKQH